MKKLTITSKDITQKQWSNLVLEMNLIKKAWASYASIEIQGPGIKKIIAHGTKNFDSKVLGDNLHTVKENGLTKTVYDFELPTSIVEKYGSLNFWRK